MSKQFAINGFLLRLGCPKLVRSGNTGNNHDTLIIVVPFRIYNCYRRNEDHFDSRRYAVFYESENLDIALEWQYYDSLLNIDTPFREETSGFIRMPFRKPGAYKIEFYSGRSSSSRKFQWCFTEKTPVITVKDFSSLQNAGPLDLSKVRKDKYSIDFISPQYLYNIIKKYNTTGITFSSIRKVTDYPAEAIYPILMTGQRLGVFKIRGHKLWYATAKSEALQRFLSLKPHSSVPKIKSSKHIKRVTKLKGEPKRWNSKTLDDLRQDLSRLRAAKSSDPNIFDRGAVK